MSFDQRFQLAGRIADTIGQSDHALAARQISSGRSVTIHLLAGGHNAANDRLLADIAALPPEYQVCFVETGDHNGTPYIITDVLTGNPPVRQWLAGLKAKLASEKAANPNDLTRVRAWKIPAAGRPASPIPEATVLAPKAAAPVPPPPAAVTAPDDDEFSRLLAAIDNAKTDAPAPAPAEPGEFTRMLRAEPAKPAEPAAPTPPSRAPEPAEPGEFTRLLRTPAGPVVMPPAVPAPPVAGAVEPESSPDSCERMRSHRPLRRLQLLPRQNRENSRGC